MTCWHRSTTSSAKAIGVASLLFGWSLASLALAHAPVGDRDAAGGDGPAIRQAIVRAVEARMGRAVHVDVVSLDSTRLLSTAPLLVAAPDPNGRIGKPVRFVLSAASVDGRAAGARVGEATAVIAVSAEVVRTRRAVARNTVVQSDDIEVVTTELRDLPFRAVPTLVTTIGARTMRDLGPLEIITDSAVVPVPVIRAGQRVRVVFRAPGVEVVGSAVAAESGLPGQTIRVMNTESRRAIFARVREEGEVEVVDGR